MQGVFLRLVLRCPDGSDSSRTWHTLGLAGVVGVPERACCSALARRVRLAPGRRERDPESATDG